MGGGETSADVEAGDYSTIVQERKQLLCCDNYRGVSLLCRGVATFSALGGDEQ